MKTTTAKTTKAPKAKKLLLTSRAKMGAARKTKKARAAEITHELVEAGTNPQAAEVLGEVMAQVPAPMDLDGNAEAPSLADTIGMPIVHAGMENSVYRYDPDERGEDGLLTERACFSRAEAWARRTGKDSRWGLPEAGGVLGGDDQGFSCTFTSMTVAEVDRRTGKCRRVGRVEVAPRPAEIEPTAPQGVTLDREPGRGFFRIHVDGTERGMLFQTTSKGQKMWAATARYLGLDLRTDARSKSEALAEFVRAIRQA